MMTLQEFLEFGVLTSQSVLFMKLLVKRKGELEGDT
jgi:hypothetical protein